MNQKQPKKPISKKRFYLSFFGAAALMMVIGAIGTNINNNRQPEQLNLGERTDFDARISDSDDSSTDLANGDTNPENQTPSSEAFSNDSKKKQEDKKDSDRNTDDKDSKKKKTKDSEETEASENAAVELEGGETPKPTATPDAATETLSTDPMSQLSFSEENGLLWPAAGDVILNYSMDRGIYFKTLGQYRCNPAILIGAEEGAEVCSASAGVVTAIDENEETGVTLTMSIGDDYELVYGQLKDVQVAVGDEVTEGQTIASIDEPTKYYVSEGTHLYFKVLEDQEPVNPMLLLR